MAINAASGPFKSSRLVVIADVATHDSNITHLSLSLSSQLSQPDLMKASCDLVMVAGNTLLVMEYMANGNLWDNLQHDSANEFRWYGR